MAAPKHVHTTGGTSLSTPVAETQVTKEVSQDKTTSMSSAIYDSPIQESISGQNVIPISQPKEKKSDLSFLNLNVAM